LRTASQARSFTARTRALGNSEPIYLQICDVKTPRQICQQPRNGLRAAGLGGIFLPLKVSVPSVTINANRAKVVVSINGVKAACTSGSVHTHAKSRLVEINHVLCNWLVIGNVFSSLKLSLDWDEPESQRFGGRYSVWFIGTGNGSGSGLYTAQVQS